MTPESEPTLPSDADAVPLRQAIALSVSAVAHGNHPFGAVLSAADGTVVLTAENTVVTTSDVTGHAETNLVRLASAAYSYGELADFTLYTSCEPCAMCCGAIFWSGIGHVVYALDGESLAAITSHEGDSPMLLLPSREVFARGGRPVDVAGPMLEDEARLPHLGFWGEPAPTSTRG